eukprot:Skav207816  [mRNA]  locus=scaffold381:467557:468525:- [translate_table: standard]
MLFTAFFTFDVLFRIVVLQRKFWRVCMNYVDVLVTLTSLVEVAFVALVLPMNPTLFRLLRIGIWELQGGVSFCLINSGLLLQGFFTKSLAEVSCLYRFKSTSPSPTAIGSEFRRPSLSLSLIE